MPALAISSADIRTARNWIASGSDWRDIDQSILEVQVIIKKDGEYGTVFPVSIEKDNLSAGSAPKVGTKLVQEGSRDILLSLVR
ncbi:MAG: hypothetical protein H7338_09265 [Candidatus Sericytochromatia bacterium]|nr:hypothetical protein [Candidatus Sericytochromatia bacterium]